MTLLDKINIILLKYNNGKDNDYSSDFKKLLEKSRTDTYDIYVINEKQGYLVVRNSYGKAMAKCNIEELIGICILENNPDLFKEG